MKPNTILWVYSMLLVLGGLIGFFKAGSKPSLIISVSFAAVLMLCAMGVVNHQYADLALVSLLIVFGWRLGKTRKFMPSGMMLILTLAALGMRHL